MMTADVTREDVLKYAPQEKAVALFLALSGMSCTGKMLQTLLKGMFIKDTPRDYERVAEGLIRQHLPIKMGMRNRAHCYTWTGTLAVDAVRELIHEVDKLRLWPSSLAWARAENDGEPSYWRPPPDIRIGEEREAITALMRLGLGETPEAFPNVLQARYAKEPLTIARGAVCRLMRILTAPPPLDFLPVDACSEAFYLCCLNGLFLKGLDVRPALARLAKHLQANGTLSTPLRHAYLALCVWTGWRAGLEMPNLKKGDKFLAACTTLLAGNGDLASADAILRKLWEAHRYDLTDQDADNFAVRLLMLTACMAAKPGKTRPAQVSKGFWGGREPVSRTDLARQYREEVRQLCYLWGDNWKYVTENTGNVLRNMEKPMFENPLTALLGAWDYHEMAVGRTALAAQAKQILRHIPAVFAQGYVNLAGLFLALMAGAYEKEEFAEIRSAVEKEGAWLLPCVAPESEWKTVLELLRTTVDKTAGRARGAPEKTHRRLFWGIGMTRVSGSDVMRLEYIRPLIANKDAWDGEEISTTEVNYLDDPRFADVMTPADRQLFRCILAAQWNTYRRNGYPFSKDVFEQLCTMSNLKRMKERESGEFEDITLEERPCAFESVVREDGGMTLGAPTWVVQYPDGFALRKIADGRYACMPITDDVRKLAVAFDRYGVKGRIEIPAEGMAEAEGLVNDLSSLVPLANPESAQKGNLPRVPGACAPVARLDFSEGVLTVHIVVRPIPANPAFTVEPGAGLAEKLVSGPAGDYLLVRDLAAEQAALAEDRTALAMAEDWYAGHATWDISDIAVAIEALSALKALGGKLPLEWIEERRLNVTAAPKNRAQLKSSRTADEWFSVKGSFTLDDGRVLSVMQLLSGISSQGGNYVRLSDGDYVTLTKAMARELAALAAVGRKKGDELEVSRAALPMLDTVFGDGEEELPLPEAMAASAAEIRKVLRRKPAVPRALQAALRPYQTEGFQWLSRLAACGFGACLADDMGLGKTVQVIALLLERIQDGPSLVVSPASVCSNWQQEIRRFAPTLNPILAFECADDALADLKPGDVVIASYGYLLFHVQAYGKKAWNGVVLDEAQAIKNDASKRAHAVKGLSARFRVAATGTPVENQLGELWSLFDFLNPGLLGAAGSFAARFTQDGKAVPALKKIVRPLILRRLKGDVLDDLPEKTEVTIPVMLGKDERSAYEGCRRKALEKLLANPEEQNHISILAELTRLRRFCCHPALVLGAEGGVPSAKMEALVDLLEGLHSGQHKALVFSQFTDYLALVRQMVEAHGWRYRYLDGATPLNERARLVNEFQTGEAEFFLISLKAGGTGLNLTAANYVILLDPWWNPAVENQAADRVHRIGQKQPVTVYRLVSSDTVEERVIELHKEKQAMARDLLEGTAKTNFSAADLIRLFK